MRSLSSRLLVVASCCVLCAPQARPSNLIISEFLASNTTGLTDEDGDDSDWIEITNVSASPVDLAGWHLSDAAASLEKWEFPSLTLASGERVVVFASGKDRAVAGQELHTNFKLSSSGELLALVRPDGVTVEYQFDPYPQQYPDISYGPGSVGGSTVQLVGPESPLRYRVPVDGSEDVGGANPWNATVFDDSAWTVAGMGVAYEDDNPNDPYYDYIGSNGDVRVPMDGQSASIYLRIPFTIENPDEVSGLTLRVRYDDGFGVTINGGSTVLASANPPSDGVWDFGSVASASHSDGAAIALEDFVIDLAAVSYMDTSVLGEVMACWKRAAECGGLVKLVLEPDGRVLQLLRLTGLDKIFDPYDGVDEAIAAF